MGIFDKIIGKDDKGMDVFVGNLHPKARPTDLESFFGGFSKNAQFKIVTKYYDNGTSYRFGMVSFDSQRVAEKAIKKLNNQYLMGKPTIVREYFHRSYHNERRDINWRSKEWDTNERRGTDRRRREVENPNKAEQELRVKAYRDLAKKDI